MQTMWPGFAVPTLSPFVASAPVTSRARSLWVRLSDTPGVITQLTLPATTRSLQFWSTDASIWYSVDALPGPIPPIVPDLIVPATAFAVGAVVLPSVLLGVTLPTDTLTHVLYLQSQAASPTVLITCVVDTL